MHLLIQARQMVSEEMKKLTGGIDGRVVKFIRRGLILSKAEGEPRCAGSSFRSDGREIRRVTPLSRRKADVDSKTTYK
jgi:RNase P/RNase MRP subunit p29